MRQGTQLIVMLMAVLAVSMALPACGGGSTGGDAGSKDLYLQKFLLVDADMNNIGGTGTTNAFRDTRILFVFNTAIDFEGSVNSRTIRIGIPTGNNLFLEAPGRFQPVEGHKNWVLFNPTFTKGNLSVDPEDADNPFGLDGNAIYEVNIPAFGDQPKLITDKDGGPIVKHFHAQFQTSTDYLQTLEQPELTKVEPADGETGVGATEDIILYFSKPMKPDSFLLGNTVIVRNITLDRSVLGTLRFSPDAKEVTFRPVFGYGKGPYEIFVRVKREVTNLSGNQIPKEHKSVFTTAQDLTQPDFENLDEDFESNTYEDTAFQATFPLAPWNQGVTSGMLAGTTTSGTITLSWGTTTYSWPPFAWGSSFTGQWQGMYTSQEMGGGRSITGFDWYYNANTSSSVSSVTVNLGHTKLGGLTTNFASNYSDSPVAVVNNITNYAINNSPTQGWKPGPTFGSTWKYNGNDNVIIEIFNTCGTIGWPTTWTGLWRVRTPDTLTRAAYTLPPAAGGGSTAQRYHYDIRFNYLIDQSEAQSLFYDTGIKSPQFLEVVLFPEISSQPAGTITTFMFRGAPEDPLNPGTPDTESLSAWVDDLLKLSGYRFVKFHVDFKANQQTGQSPAFDNLIVPFIFY